MQRDVQYLEQRWGLAIQNAAFGVWDLDVPGQTVHYPPQWKTMLGYPGTDEPDSTTVWRDRVHPADRPAMLAALGAHLAGDEAGYTIEFRLRAADGGYRWVLSRGRVVERDAEGRALRAVGTLTDLTDRREAERQRARAEVLARASHELRTPLNAVLGFAQLLQQDIGRGDLAEQRRHAAHIEQAGWKLLQMVDEMLAQAER